MFRLTSFLALACLTLAATALLANAKSFTREQPQNENDGTAQSRNRFIGSTPESTVSFHARFSLN